MIEAQKTSPPVPGEYRRYDRRPLEALFRPGSIAVVGASEKPRNLGRMALWNLIRYHFGGTVFPVNPQCKSVLGIKTDPKLTDIDEPIDLAIIATQAAVVPEIIEQCIEKKVGAALIISSGFSECGDAGCELEAKILARAQACGLQILGPNSAGLMMPHAGLNASIHHAMPMKGHVGLISQSSSIAAAILDWSAREKVGFSAFVSGGNMADINWGELIYYLGEDPHTHSIVIYLQSLRDARSFLSATREIALSKPIIVLKSGQSSVDDSRENAQNGDLISQHDVLDAAFRRSGILPVKSLVDLFAMSEILSKQPPAQGRRLAIVTNAGGAGIQARARLREGGGKMAEFSDETIAALKGALPEKWRPGNPVHLFRDADAARYEKALAVLSIAKEIDGLLVILVPRLLAEPSETARKMTAFAKLSGKPFLASWMGGEAVAEGKNFLNEANIPTFPFPDTAATIFNYMWQYTYNLRGLFETPHLPADDRELASRRDKAAAFIDELRTANKTALSLHQSRQILEMYGIPVSSLRRMVKPYQLILGSVTDRLFGPVLYCGAGGALGRVFKDVAVALPPLNSTLARRMMEQTHIYAAMRGEAGGAAIPTDHFEQLLVRFSQLVVEQRRIKSIKINPLKVTGKTLAAQKVQIVLHDPKTPARDLPRPAIRPYPIRYVRTAHLRDGAPIIIRPIRPEDEPLMVKFHENLSDRSVYLRYFYPLNIRQRISHERLARICFIDYDREMVLVVEKRKQKTGDPEIIAVGRLNKLRGVNEAEFAVTIDDAYQRQGLGVKILSQLVEIGRREKLDRIVADILPENRGMQRVSEKVGFALQFNPDEQVVKAVIDLTK